MNKKKKEFDDSVPRRVSIESAGEGTLMGRLAERMAARDMIDELNMGPKGRSGDVKRAQVADMEYPKKMSIGGPALKTGTKIEAEHKETVDALKDNPKMPNKTVYKNIAKDHLSEHDLYYDKKKGLPNMEENLSRQGNTMRDQAINAGNVFNTMHQRSFEQQKSLKK